MQEVDLQWARGDHMQSGELEGSMPASHTTPQAPFVRARWREQRPELDGSALRIGVTGAQGVGKTTFTEALAAELGLPAINEMARTVQELGFPLGLETTLLSQVAMWFSQFDLEFKQTAYVADRTLFDVLTHGELFAERSHNKQDRLLVNAIGNATACIIRNHYHLIFYIPIEFPLTGDGIRDSSREFQKALDAKTYELLQMLNIPFVQVGGSFAQRLGIARRVIAERFPNFVKKEANEHE